MALIINTPIETNEGLIVENMYVRLSVTNTTKGSIIEGSLELYVSKVAYNSNKSKLSVDNHILKQFFGFNYDRITMGTDTLGLAHDVLIASLLEQGIVAVKELV